MAPDHDYRGYRTKVELIQHLKRCHPLTVEGDERMEELREAHEWLHGKRYRIAEPGRRRIL
jgi:hypothetical protein